jgi:hypothetical protein
MRKAPMENRLSTWTAAMTAAAATGFAPWPRDGLAAETERIAEAFNWTVVFLMAMPYATLACCVGWIVYRYTRSPRARDGGQGQLHIVKKGEC